MPEILTDDFDLDLDAEAYDPLNDTDSYDPLADTDDAEAESADAPAVADQSSAAAPSQAASKTAPEADTRDASERTADLFDHMPRERSVLMGILAFLDTAQPFEGLRDEVDRLQEHHGSVYDAASYTSLLQRAGAIERVTEDGEPIDDATKQPPEIVEVDGVEFYKPAEAPAVFLQVTDAGRAYRQADDPNRRMHLLFAEQVHYLPIVKRILEVCNVEGGVPIAKIAKAVDDDPLLQKPRRYAQYFTEKLEACDAIAWNGSWQTTDIGRRGLEDLADIDSGTTSTPSSEE